MDYERIEKLFLECQKVLMFESPTFHFEDRVKADVNQYLSALRSYLPISKLNECQPKKIIWLKMQLSAVLAELKKMKEEENCGIGLTHMFYYVF